MVSRGSKQSKTLTTSVVTHEAAAHKLCPFSESDFSRTIMYKIHEFYTGVQKHLDQILLKAKTLSFSQFIIASRLSCESDPLSQSSLAEKLAITEATMSRHISSLITRGYVEKTRDPKNKKRLFLTLTTSGEKALTSAHTLVARELETIFTPLTQKERATMLTSIDSLLSSLLSKR